MKPSVAGMFGVVAIGLALGGCDVGKQVELSSSKVYCLVDGESYDDASLDHCSQPRQLMLVDEDGNLESLSWDNRDVEFVTRAHIGEGTLTYNQIEYRLRLFDEQITLVPPKDADDGYKRWLVSMGGQPGRGLRRLHRALAKLDAEAAISEDDHPYVNVPLCEIEAQFTNNRATYVTDPCGYKISYFVDNGRVIEILTESIGEGKELKWGYAGRWSMDGDVGRPDQLSEFSWRLSEDGLPVSERRRDNPQRQKFGQQRAYDRNVLETQIGYPVFDGALRDEVQRIYETEIYPVAQRRELLSKHIPNWDDY